MAKRKSYKSLEGLNRKLQSQIQSTTTTTVDNRITTLEKEVKDSITLAMSMIAVNKELINRLQEEQQTGTASRATDTGRVSDQDTSADILAKIFNFFVKGSERDKRNFELQRDFAEERAMESKRRKPIARKSASKINPKKPSNNPIMDLLGFIGKGVGSIFKFVTGGLFEIIGKGLTGIKNVIGGITESIMKKIYKIPVFGSLMKLGAGVFDSIFGTLGFLGNTVKGILSVVTGLGGFVVNMVYKVLKTAGGLIFRTIWPVLSAILEKSFGAAGMLSGAVSRIITNPIGALSAAGTIAYESFKDEGALDQEERLYFGDEVFQLKKRKIQLQKELNRSIGTGVNPQRDESRKKEIAEIDAKLPAAYDKYLNEVVTPAMESAGYKKEIVYDTADPGGPGIVAFKRLNEKGDVEQVLYRGAGESKDRDGDIRYDLKSTEERFSPKKVASISDQAIIGKNIAGEKIAQGLEQKAESVKSSLVSTASRGISDLTGGAISESTVNEGFTKLGQLTSSQPTAAPAPSPVTRDISSPKSESISAPAVPTVAPAPQSIPTPIPNLQDYDNINVGKTEVINMPTQTNTAVSESEFDGTPNVRNPNPIVYRTAMRNDQAQP